jgi:hypothetical protein
VENGGATWFPSGKTCQSRVICLIRNVVLFCSQFTFIQLRAGAADCRVVLREYVLFVQPSLFQLYWLESTGLVGDTCYGTTRFVLVGCVLCVNFALNLTVVVLYTICIEPKTIQGIQKLSGNYV